MKNPKLKMKNKGKVYPSPSSPSSPVSSSTANRDAPSVLKLLPVAILALISVLSTEEQEALAYIIARSMKSANLSSIADEKKKSNKKSNAHKPPVFDCECFDCYTSYWFRWDSSPNRELIHEAIETFEGHLASGEQSKRNSRGKRREKMGRRSPAEKSADVPGIAAPQGGDDVPEVYAGYVVDLPGKVEESAGDGGDEEEEAGNDSLGEEMAPPEAALVLHSSSADNHKGLAWKVLPDVVGLLNSRLWSLWSPNI